MNIKILLFGASLGIAVQGYSQNHQLSLGADVGIPFGDMSDDGASLILGPTIGYETPTFGLSRFSLTLQTGYQLVFMDENPNTDEPRYTGWNMVPAQLGLKYYFTEPQLGMYAHVQGGIHMLIREFGEVEYEIVADVDTAGGADPDPASVTLPTLGVTSTLFSYAIGVGYQTERLDVALRYNGMGADEEGAASVQVPGQPNEQFTYPRSPAYSYIGIRIAYLFNLGPGARATAPPPTAP